MARYLEIVQLTTTLFTAIELPIQLFFSKVRIQPAYLQKHTSRSTVTNRIAGYACRDVALRGGLGADK